MVRTLSVADAQALIAQGGVDLIDVRESHEWQTGHLPGARLLPLGLLTADLQSARLGTKVLFVCESGSRSRRAADFVESHGVPEVFTLEGGTRAWRAAGLPIEGPPAPEVDDAPSPELDAIVGANVKQLRTQRSMSLDELAGHSGVGRQLLGQIELGRTAASLGTLWKIARAFDVPFSVLLARPGTAETRLFRSTTAKRIVDADGRFSSRALFSPDDTGGAFEFYELWIAGHAREDAEPHAPGTRENLLVTSGRLNIEIGTKRFELAKGDAIAFAADVKHAYINPSEADCTMSLVMTYRTPQIELKPQPSPIK
jgi:rhodanese-related sulfurtransferase/transcriptional regulator with XRE-family HTH domain